MPSSDAQVYGFGEKGYDWDRYARVRPKYPDSLCRQILDYHRAHGGSFDKAHDIGTGLGIVAQKYLISTFDHVFASDPVEHNIAAARERLGPREARGELTIHKAGAEERWLPNASIDLVTAFECLHWSNCHESIPAIAAQLKSGGTFTALYYTPQPLILGNTRAQSAWHDVFEKFSVRQYEPDSTTTKFLGRCFHGLDGHVNLPSETWQPGARWITINAELLNIAGDFNHPETPFQIGSRHIADGHTNLIGKDDICASVVDIETWSEIVDVVWLLDLVQSLQPKMPIERVEQELQELKAALQETGGTVQIVWIVQVLLATKR